MTSELDNKKFGLSVEIDQYLLLDDFGDPEAALMARRKMEELYGRDVNQLEVMALQKYRRALRNDDYVGRDYYLRQLDDFAHGEIPFEYKPLNEQLRIRRVQVRAARKTEPKNGSYKKALENEYNELLVKCANEALSKISPAK